MTALGTSGPFHTPSPASVYNRNWNTHFTDGDTGPTWIEIFCHLLPCFHNHLPKQALGSLGQFQESTRVTFPTFWEDSDPSQLMSLHDTPTSSSGPTGSDLCPKNPTIRNPTATHASQRFLQYFSPVPFCKGF